MLPNLGNTVSIFAHPDDDWYSCAATLRAQILYENFVTAISATNGGAGSRDHEQWHPDDIGTIREGEARKAFGRIGVSDVRFLDQRDGELGLIAFDEGVELILTLLRELDPDTVITYGSDGLTGHIDHKVISAWVTEAVAIWMAENTVAGIESHIKLLYVVADHKFVEHIVPLLHADQAIYEAPTAVHADNLFINHRLDDEEIAIKQAGIADHHTQSDPLGKGIGGIQLLDEFWFRRETLVRADLTLLVELHVELLLSSVA